MASRSAPFVGALLALWGCSAPSVPSRATIDEPRYLGFRCVRQETAADGTTTEVGLPIEDCGCVERQADGTFRELGRVECACRVLASPTPGGAERHTCFNGIDDDGDGKTDHDDPDCRPTNASTTFSEGGDDPCADGRDDDGDGLIDSRDPDCLATADLPIEEAAVGFVKGDAQGKPVRDPTSGDWVPVASGTAGAVKCAARGTGELRAYVGATGRGEVAVLDLSDDNEIDDVDRSIPGATAVYIGDIISDVGAHPYGDFVFTVNSSKGSLSVIRDDRDVRPAYEVDVADEPLLDTVVWPSPGATLLEEARPAPRAYVSAPTGGRILEIDLDALGKADQAQAPDVVLRTIALAPGPDGKAPRAGKLAIHRDGHTLYVAHADEPMLTAVDLDDPSRQTTVSLVPEQACGDGYLTGLVDPTDRDVCSDGIDNDGDGQIDAADPDCASGPGWENWEGAAWVPGCSRVAECGDGVDNDGDGLVDTADPDCAADFRWERPTPQCSNGLDDDGDGQIDRADPDCLNEADDNESGHEGSVGADVCSDGVDNDGDGLTDGEDPGCVDQDAAKRFDFEAAPECGNGEDDDGDGLADFPADPDCYAASDTNEGGEAARLGPAALVAATVDSADGPRSFVYAADRASGDVFAIETEGDGMPLADAKPQRIRVGGAVQSMTLRQTASDASIPLVDDQAVLRSIQITAPVPLVDQAGREVFARMQTPSGGACARGEVQIAGFYVVDRGAAWAVEDDATKPYVDRCVVSDRIELPISSGEVQSLGPDAASPKPFQVLDPANPTVDPRGSNDPIVLVGGSHPVRRVLNDQINVLRSAFGRTTTPGDPALRIDQSTTTFDPTRMPGFCRLESPLEAPTCANGVDDDGDGQIDAADSDCSGDGAREGTADPCSNDNDDDGDGLTDDADPGCSTAGSVAGGGPETSACLVSGFDANGRVESRATFDQRTQNRVSPSESIEIVEEDPRRVPGGRWTVAFEGEIPGSESRSGMFGGRSDDGTQWTLIDDNEDFCREGVQAGDVVLVDRFIPATADDIVVPSECSNPASLSADQKALCERRTTCRTLQRAPELAAGQRQLEPLRYEIVSTTAHKLVLAMDPRQDFGAMLPADVRSTLPALAPSPPIPYSQCAAELIPYHVRVANQEWLFTTNGSFPHPIVNQDGQCVEDARRVAQGRVGRFQLGEVFQNAWVRFKLGHLPFSGQNASSLPFMVGVAYDFTVTPGVAFASLPDVAVLPQDMGWTPFDDRLYVVDSAFETVVEVTGLDLLRTVGESFVNSPTMRLVRRFE